jgi:GT2 family glycosyltransferase
MGSFFFKRKLFEQIGYLDEYFHFHCSDTDYNRRIRLKGHKIAIVPDSDKYMFHEHQQGTHNFFKGNHQAIIDNDWVMFAKKWNDHDGKHADGDISLDCPRCIEIAQTQLPLGRTRYLYGKT